MVRMSRDRRKEFKKALIDAGITQADFCRQQGITYRHLVYVLTGKRESDRLNAIVNEFIESHQQVAA